MRYLPQGACNLSLFLWTGASNTGWAVQRDLVTFEDESKPGNDVQYYALSKKVEGQKMSSANILDIAHQICLGLVFLHSQKIVHGNINGNTVFLGRGNSIKIAYITSGTTSFTTELCICSRR